MTIYHRSGDVFLGNDPLLSAIANLRDEAMVRGAEVVHDRDQSPTNRHPEIRRIRTTVGIGIVLGLGAVTVASF